MADLVGCAPHLQDFVVAKPTRPGLLLTRYCFDLDLVARIVLDSHRGLALRPHIHGADITEGITGLRRSSAAGNDLDGSLDVSGINVVGEPTLPSLEFTRQDTLCLAMLLLHREPFQVCLAKLVKGDTIRSLDLDL